MPDVAHPFVVQAGSSLFPEVFMSIKKDHTFTIIFIIVCALTVRTFFFSSIIVKGVSMEPTFFHGDFVIGNRLVYTGKGPQRGDLVICRANDSEFIVKRVIGLPGDVVEIRFNGAFDDLYINGELMNEEYLPEPMMQKGDVEYPYTVPEGKYFVMGDNRNISNDSRFKAMGDIAEDDVEGRADIILYPFSRLGKADKG